MSEEVKICQHEGCTNPGQPCELPWVIGPPDKEPEYEYFCSMHAQEHGYCWMCGYFWRGAESFEFSKSGLCENCKSELDAEFDEEMVEFLEELP